MYINWICKNCETKNEAYQRCCYVCGALRDETNTINEFGASTKQRSTDESTHSIEMKMKDDSK